MVQKRLKRAQKRTKVTKMGQNGVNMCQNGVNWVKIPSKWGPKAPKVLQMGSKGLAQIGSKRSKEV